MKPVITLCLAITALGSSAVMAAEFSDFDLDQDGFISKSEAALSDSLTAIFDKLDSNEDGKLSPQELIPLN
ncbi:EF-hand domain-containing protein [Pseudoalteromonas sp. J010]|uniref:EF-hand domain-containing protein n=1 Tax=Pseudoalteromonas sp. J010 TaxID=998465 RepID=UPI000F651DDB|nr:EF-hand domain-containing protein [Pseudoalteromonas sp. J010]RRS08424.1 EF-hand domain-containing protein [Pseudoalteromonas sp. J010]